MPPNSFLDRRTSPWLAMAIVFVVVSASGFAYLDALKSESDAKSRLALSSRVANHIQSVRTILLKAQEPLFTLSDIVSITRGDFNQFDLYARSLLATNSDISGLFLAPGGVVQLAEPLQGNEAAIGHDLMKDPDRRKEVEEAIAANETVLAGPVNMRQGGVGLFARKPIFWDENGRQRFWGLAIALIKWETIKKAMDFETLSADGYAYTLNRKLGTDPQPVLLLRSPEDVLSDVSVSRSFAIPGGEWILTLSEKERPLQTKLYAGFITVFVAALLFSMLIFTVLQSSREMKRQATSLRSVNAKLGNRLKERDVLLREVHHRVKNNLQIIVSLLDLQSMGVENSEFDQLVFACKDRVKAIALAHEQLYKSNDLGAVNAKDYFEGVSRNILQGCTGLVEHVKCSVHAPKATVALGVAVPLGLIVTELMTNALKHAFKGVRNPEILISFVLNAEELATVSVNDNGHGFPDGKCPESSSTLGLVLVRSLAKQLKGTMACHNHGGAFVSVCFPLPMGKNEKWR